ncbi:MAG: sensor histidine kinase [Tidjanibacter sp.]|nr:sensor histidine kinase [Tidjanibacter sp.]
MKIKTINSGAFIVGLITILCVTVGLIIGHFVRTDGWWWGLVFAIGSGFIVFMGAKGVTKNFFIQRIKPLYRIVLGRDIKTTELAAELEQTNHPERSVSAELNRWAEQNQKEIARLKENEKYRKEFVGNVSHEIKTPIFNIQGYISTLLDGGMNDPVIFRRYLERTEKSIDRLINITNDLEAISKLESGVLTLSYERFDIVSLTRDIVDTIEFEATKKNISVVVGSSHTVPYPPVWVKADPYYIEQVLINLIINSIRYGNEGGETFIKFIDLFDKVLVEVRDNGRGISKEDIPRVFERFYRTDKGRSREQGGTGLGLSIVKHILEAHGETINLRSELGKGSTFSFTLSKN